MPEGKRVLITRPRHDPPTSYLFYWNNNVIEQSQRSGHTTTCLDGEKANAAGFLGRMKKLSPNLVILNGHGNSGCVGGHNNEPLVSIDNAEVLAGSITYAVACSSAKELGPKAVEKGAAAFVGYKEEFVALVDEEHIQTRPLDDQTARYFFEPSNKVAISLLKGNSAASARESAMNLYRQSLRALQNSESSIDAGTILPYLYHNMSNLVVVGDESATI